MEEEREQAMTAEWGNALQACLPDVPICIPCAEELLMQTYGAVDPAPRVLQYTATKYTDGRDSIAFVLDTPALLKAARAAGHRQATQASKLVVPPSDGEFGGMNMCSECATALRKIRRILKGLSRGETGVEVV